MGKYNEALIENQKGHKLANELNLKFLLMYIYEDYYEIYDSIGDYEKALKNYQISIAYKDSLFSQKQTGKIKEIELKYENEAKERELELLREKDRYQDLLNRALLAGISVLLIISILIIRSIILKRKHDKALHEKNNQLLRAEIEKKESEEEKLKGEVEFKSKQLTTHALTMIQKNKILQDTNDLIDKIKKSTKNPELINDLNTHKSNIRHNLKTEKDWELFKMYFEQVNSEFFDTLLKLCPNLNNYDLRQCALIKLNLNIKESASVLNLSPHTVKSARYRLKKKLKLEAEDDLSEFIRQI
jgi:DNA-binding CsgD family transcriptional regulator